VYTLGTYYILFSAYKSVHQQIIRLKLEILISQNFG